ncbi:MAG: DUF5958 family protein [Saprospiraceae bacterium]
MLDKDVIIINKIAQDLLSIEDGILWFDTLTETDKQSVLVLIKFFIEQAHPTNEIISEAIRKIPLTRTMTPVVLLNKNSFKIALSKILALPTAEYKKVFISLITIFKAGDSYRRNNLCKNGCTHEWHNLI